MCPIAEIHIRTGNALYKYQLSHRLSLDGSGSFAYSDFSTPWFGIQPEGLYPLNLNNYIGELIIDGSTGRADIKFTVYDHYNKPVSIMERSLVPIKRILLGGFRIKARLVRGHTTHYFLNNENRH